jgi:hypothetical protein
MSDERALEASIGFGILSWRGYASVAAALETYRSAGLFEMFDRSLLFLPQIEDAGVEIAERFGLPFAGTPDNLGILGGFKALAQALTTDVIVLAENDYILVEPREEAERQLTAARRHIEAGDAHVWRLRFHGRPSLDHGYENVQAYWPPASASAAKRLGAAARRLLRPGKAGSLIGSTAFIYEAPERRFPDDFRRTEEGDLLIRSRALPWANNVFMIRREFFLNVVIPAAEARVRGRLINGFPTIETELNRGWWRRQDFWTGLGRGLFTHRRLADRGY